MKSTKFSFMSVTLVLFLSFFINCGGGGGGDSSSSSSSGGTLSLSMTDASADEFAAVYVTIDEVQIHLGGSDGNPNNWQNLKMQRSPVTVDLLKLTNGVREQLGIVELPVGDYTQVRLIIGETPEDTNLPYANYVVDKSTPANIFELKIPSGTNTGFKIVENFTIADKQTLELVLDFDASRSVIQAGSSGQWLLKPTVKIENLKDASIVKGRVTDGTNGISKAIVSAQKYDATKPDDKDKVSVETSTLTDADGNYALFLKPGTYNIVATAENKTPDFEKKTTTAGQTYDEANAVNFLLSGADVSEVAGTVLITGAGLENYATLSFRQGANFGGPTDEIIEVKSINVINGAPYSINLPVGDYTLVASSFSYPTQTVSPPLSVVKEVPDDIPTDGSVTF
jgi:hypothetical protein